MTPLSRTCGLMAIAALGYGAAVQALDRGEGVVLAAAAVGLAAVLVTPVPHESLAAEEVPA